MNYLKIISFFLVILLFSCNDEEKSAELASADERVEAAVESLRDQLTSPEFGWQLRYKPTNESGEYYILLNFTEDQVMIKSDVPYDDGYLYDQTIPYRIDAQLGIELIFETYAAFHFLFEQDQSTFGAEFQFIFVDELGDNLRFISKSDGFGETSYIIFEPASSEADQNFSRAVAENFQAFGIRSPIIFGGESLQQLYLASQDISIFWNIDLVKRNVILDVAAVGETDEEIVSNDQMVSIDHASGYTFLNDKLVLQVPFSFSLNGGDYTIDEILMSDFSLSGEIYCIGGTENSAVYDGSIAKYGGVVLKKTYFQSGGLKFKTQEESYGVNPFFTFDNEANSLLDNGVIGEFYPDATGFVFHFGFISDVGEMIPSYGVGMSFIDENNKPQLHMRAYDMSTLQGNALAVQLNDEFYFSDGGTAADEQNMRQITDEIFEGHKVYITLLDDENVNVFRLFNPCNQYEIFLVE